MLAKISIGQLCGFLYLFILLTSVLSKFMVGAPPDAENVPNELGAVAEGGKKFRISIVVDLVSHASVIALAGLLYLAFSPYNRSLALVGTLWRVAEGTILVLNETNNILLLAVAQKFVSATGKGGQIGQLRFQLCEETVTRTQKKEGISKISPDSRLLFSFTIHRESKILWAGFRLKLMNLSNQT
jgi:hypothetical protein